MVYPIFQTHLCLSEGGRFSCRTIFCAMKFTGIHLLCQWHDAVPSVVLSGMGWLKQQWWEISPKSVCTIKDLRTLRVYRLPNDSWIFSNPEFWCLMFVSLYTQCGKPNKVPPIFGGLYHPCGALENNKHCCHWSGRERWLCHGQTITMPWTLIHMWSYVYIMDCSYKC
jgi:hypothetical protein